MTNFIVIFLCLAAGLLFRGLKHFPASSPKALNSFIIYLSLPAVILTQVPVLLRESSFDRTWLVPMSMAWILFGASWLVFDRLGRKLGWSRSVIGAVVLTAGLGNTSFVGFPLLEALMGPEAVRIGILTDQPGTFLVVSTLGLAVAAFYAGSRVTAASLTKRIFSFPPFLALLASLVWTTVGAPGIAVVTPAFAKIGGTLVPLALFSVGLQLRVDRAVLATRRTALGMGLVFKLLLAPAAFALVYLGLAGMRGPIVHVTILESGMASMITAAVVVGDFGLDTEVANLMVGVGIPLSLLTVPLWDFALRAFV